MAAYFSSEKMLLTAVLAALSPAYVCAQTQSAAVQTADADTGAAQSGAETELETVNVSGRRKINRRQNDVTGLGKIAKDYRTISKEQVLGIRDLVRYDPGVSVVEQNRGGSAGYAIRGVDKNRVAVTVDGIMQAQSYVMQGQRGGGGSMNEIENENVTAVEISKGGASAEFGSGALGGAVAFRTKEAEDILLDGRRAGLATKNAYSSKNSQQTHSVGFAGRRGGWEGLVQYTYKTGKETAPHKDLDKIRYDVRRLGAYLNEYDLRYAPGQTVPQTYFLIEDECPGLDCVPNVRAKVTQPGFRQPSSRQEPYTPEENAQIQQSLHPVERMGAKAYSGSARVLPDPMEYKTGSWLAKLGYRFNAEHRLQAVAEHTVQDYDIRDMSLPAYYLPQERGLFTGNGIYRKGGSIADGVNIQIGPITQEGVPSAYKDIGLKWSRTRFYDEKHTKKRLGIGYVYTPQASPWADKVSLSYDYQGIDLDSLMTAARCAVYPAVDKNCRPSVDKPGSYFQSERSIYGEKHHLLRFSLDKKFELGGSRHDLRVDLGADNATSTLDRSDYFDEYVVQDWQNIGGSGSRDDPYIYRLKHTALIHDEQCRYASSAFRDCARRLIKGKNRYVSLRNLVKINPYLDIGVGVRYDSNRFSTEDSWSSVKNYRNVSWNGGIVFKPTETVSLLYKASTGFRVPSYQEMFGWRVPGFEKGRDEKAHFKSDLRPEKALNQEIGFVLDGTAGRLEASYFRNDYTGLIALAEGKRASPADTRSKLGYYNAQDVKLAGVNIQAKLYWNALSGFFPEGLYSGLAYGRIKPRSVSDTQDFAWVRSHLLDAVQPQRYVLSVGYDHPEDKWGIKTLLTYSKGKNPRELLGKYTNSLGETYTANATTQTTGSWKTVDVIGYLKFKKQMNLGFGVYNLFNYRYLTWESVRQTAAGAINRPEQVGNYARYAAPGRNFTVSLQMKF